MGGESGQRVYIFLLALLGCFIFSSLGQAQEDKDKKDLRPERGIAIYSEYSSVTVPRGEAVKMDLTLENKGGPTKRSRLNLHRFPKGGRLP